MEAKAPTSDSTRALSDFARTLRYDRLPETALRAARQCLIDAVACAIFGSRFPWSKMIVAATEYSPGPSAVPGVSIRTTPDKAALFAGAFSHAFELDSLRKPGIGVHGGATVALPALIVGQAVGASGKDVLTAIVAGCEVMFRIGVATKHSAEKRGFHAPGITGVFGSAVTSGLLTGLSAEQLGHAMGLSGSMASGILAFAGNGTGGMVKRLHLGRAAEAGVIAAKLAKAGFEAPRDVLEAHYGVFECFCAESDPALLTKDLGREFEIEKLCIKHYACHVTAQAPVELITGWMAKEKFLAADVRSIELDVPPKVASHHLNRRPTDLALAQYSVPFMVAFAMHHEIADPATLTEEAVLNPAISRFAETIKVTADDALKGWAIRVRLTLRDGRSFSGEATTFKGAPEKVLSDADLFERFMTLTRQQPAAAMEALYARLARLDDVPDVSELRVSDTRPVTNAAAKATA